MIDKLKDIIGNSYSPYSGYPVAAFVITKDGREFSGVNVENASYGACICAERTALVKAVSEGARPGDFRSLHLMVGSGKIGMPCFMCRQMITEFFDPECDVVCWSTSGDKREYKVSEICPEPFSKEDLM